MFSSRQCPSEDQLRQLASGSLPDPPGTDVERHLLECDTCAQRTAEIELTDTLIAALQQQNAGPALADGQQQRVAAIIDMLSSMPSSAERLAQNESGADGSPGENRPETVLQEFVPVWQAAEGDDELGRFGGYRILKLLGAGGMGAVFLAEDMQLKRPVALKLMRPRAAATLGAAERCLRKARAAAALHHEHVVHIYQVGQEGGIPFLAMEFLSGETLDQRLHKADSLAVGEVLDIGRAMADGLAAAHEAGVIHRDIKPANVFLVHRSGRAAKSHGALPQVKLLDFGLARPLAEDVRLTQSGMILGTPAYMAPEQAVGQAVDARADLFSLGSVLYRMLTGQSAFPGTNVISVLSSLANQTPPPPHAVRADVPQALSDLVMQLLQKDPAARPASAAEVLARLESLPETRREAVQAPAPVIMPASANGGRGGRRWLTALGFAGMAAAALAVIVIKLKDDQGKETVIRVETSPGTKVTNVTEEPASRVPAPVASPAIAGKATQSAAIAAKPPAVAANEPEPTNAAIGLDPAAIPADERFPWQPKELVAVIGSHRFTAWYMNVQIALDPTGNYFVASYPHRAAEAFSTTGLESLANDLPHIAEFSVDGTLAVGADCIYKLVGTDRKHPRFEEWRRLPTETFYLRRTVLSPDNRWAIQSCEKKLLVYDLQNNPPTVAHEIAAEHSLLQITRDGKKMLSGARDSSSPPTVWNVDWNAAGGPRLQQSGKPFPGNAAKLSPAGDVLVTHEDQSSKCRVFNLQDPDNSSTVEIDGGDCFEFSADGELFATKKGQLAIRVYRRMGQTWQSIHEIVEASGANVTALAFTPDNRTLVVGDLGGRVNVWDLSQQPAVLKNPPQPAGRIRDLVLSADGHALSTRAWNGGAVWDLTGRTPRRYSGELERKEYRSFSPDGNILCQADPNPEFWQLSGTKLERLHVLDPPADPFTRFSSSSNMLICMHHDAGQLVIATHPWHVSKRGTHAIEAIQDAWRSSAAGGPGLRSGRPWKSQALRVRIPVGHQQK